MLISNASATCIDFARARFEEELQKSGQVKQAMKKMHDMKCEEDQRLILEEKMKRQTQMLDLKTHLVNQMSQKSAI